MSTAWASQNLRLCNGNEREITPQRWRVTFTDHVATFASHPVVTCRSNRPAPGCSSRWGPAAGPTRGALCCGTSARTRRGRRRGSRRRGRCRRRSTPPSTPASWPACRRRRRSAARRATTSSPASWATGPACRPRASSRGSRASSSPSLKLDRDLRWEFAPRGRLRRIYGVAPRDEMRLRSGVGGSGARRRRVAGPPLAPDPIESRRRRAERGWAHNCINISVLRHAGEELTPVTGLPMPAGPDPLRTGVEDGFWPGRMRKQPGSCVSFLFPGVPFGAPYLAGSIK
jgi:hypothetical protein